MSRVTFNNKHAIFFSTINSRVEDYFNKGKLRKTGNLKLYLKSIILISLAVVTYTVLVTVHLNPFIAILLCIAFGLEQAAIGFNVMHDANHCSFSQKKWVNNIMGLTANMMGTNAWIWKQKHNIIHHTYTNVDGVDDDIAKSPFMRMCPSQKKYKLHRYQYIYAIPLYGLTAILMFLTDFVKYFSNNIKAAKLQPMKTREHIIFWISKALYIFIYVAVPVWLVGLGAAMAGFAIMHLALGITLAVVFQLAHVVEATHFVDAQAQVEPLNVQDEWAIHQVRTTADFATSNKIISWFTGGLNFQVEHHLFPKISHVHYPAIHKIVKEVCGQYSVQFNNYPSMTSALRSHLRFLKQLGKE